MIEAIQLSKKFGGQQVVNQLDLKVAAGEIFCLLGQNGAGKTTSINCFLGFVEPTSGKALIGGMDVQKEPIRTKEIMAYLPEVVMLYPNLTGLENLEYFSRLAGFRYDKKRLEQYLLEVGLPAESINRRAHTYSKGMRQKVGIAVSLAKQAKALFLDEPTSGLDPKAGNDFSVLLKQLATAGMAILMATHDIFRAREIASRIGIMKEGRLVAEHAGNALSTQELEAVYLETV